MSSLRHSFIGLCLVSSTIGGFATIAASPVQAAPAKESKASQCQRYSQMLATYSQNMARTRDKNIQQTLAESTANIKLVKARQFSDPKIRRFHQQFINFSIDMHNQVVNITNAVNSGDRDSIQRAFASADKFMESPVAEQTDQAITAYCGSNYGKKYR